MGDWNTIGVRLHQGSASTARQDTAYLFSNSLKYASGKPIEITVEADDRVARIELRDPESESQAGVECGGCRPGPSKAT